MTTTALSGAGQETKVSTGSLFGAGFLGGAIAAVVNLVLYFGAGAAGVSFAGEFGPGVDSLPIPAIAISSIFSAVPAAIVALILLKVTPAKAATTFAIVSVVFCVLSFGGPFGVKGLGTGGLVVMELMHVVAAAGIGGFIWRKLSAR
jgi:hypothetical protein